MDSTFDAVVSSWPSQPWLAVALLYHSGDLSARLVSTAPPRSRSLAALAAISFAAGLATIYLALASPIEVFASL